MVAHLVCVGLIEIGCSQAPSLAESIRVEIRRRFKAYQKKKAAKTNVKQMDDDANDNDEADEEVEDDTLGALREINLEYRAKVGKEKAREGISQLHLRKLLADKEVPESQVDYMFSKYINHEEEADAGEEGELLFFFSLLLLAHPAPPPPPSPLPTPSPPPPPPLPLLAHHRHHVVRVVLVVVASTVAAATSALHAASLRLDGPHCHLA